jgi:hypothetical protein
MNYWNAALISEKLLLVVGEEQERGQEQEREQEQEQERGLCHNKLLRAWILKVSQAFLIRLDLPPLSATFLLIIEPALLSSDGWLSILVLE